MENLIEIPFGAYDSELRGFEYTIPDGYEAEIKDGKVMIVRKKENEDEKIRKGLIEYFKYCERNGSKTANTINISDILTWLEKQKPVENVNGAAYGIDGLWHAITILEKTLGKVEGYQSDDGILEHKCAITAVRDLAKKQREQKPVEWSEEDEHRRTDAIYFLETAKKHYASTTEIDATIDWLKSLKNKVVPQEKLHI